MSLLFAAMVAAPAAAPAPQACVFDAAQRKLSYTAKADPARDAATRSWYVAGEKIAYNYATYRKYGTPVRVSPANLNPIGLKDEVPLFADAKAHNFDMIYVLVQSWRCTFQPYVKE